MLATQAHVLVTSMATQTLGEILRPTKGADSYEKIANRANEWFRKQIAAGRELHIRRMSSEQVRRIFEDQIERPASVYLEALAAAQEVDFSCLKVAAGYEQPSSLVPAIAQALPPVSDITEEEKSQLLDMIKGYSSAQNETTRHYMAEAVKKILEEEKKEECD